MNKIIREWLRIKPNGISIGDTWYILLFTDDQVVFTATKDDLQKNVHKLNKIALNFGMKITENKQKRWPS